MKNNLETFIPALLVQDVFYSVDVWGNVNVETYRVIVEGALSMSSSQLYELNGVWSLMADEIALGQAEKAAQRRAEDRAALKSWDLNR